MKKKWAIAGLIMGMFILIAADIAIISWKHHSQIVCKEEQVVSLKSENIELKQIVDTLSRVCVRQNIKLPSIKKNELQLAGVKHKQQINKEDTITFCTRLYLDRNFVR